MNRIMCGVAAALCVLASGMAWADKGEYWEATSKMEMAGMPMAMPAQTSKVCLAVGTEKGLPPAEKDSNCQMTDIKTSGNTVRWKVKCVTGGEAMNGDGESTHGGDSYHGKMHMKGKSGGEPVEMVSTFSGKRLGGSCDTDAQAKQAKAQMDSAMAEQKRGMAQACDTSGYKAVQWVSSAGIFLGNPPTCPGKKDALCKALRNDVPHDVNAFEMLQEKGQERATPSAVKECGLDMGGMKKALCRNKAHAGPQAFLDKNCPAEAKEFREWQRKREVCEGRGYTAGAKMKECMGGDLADEDGVAPSGAASGAASAKDAATNDSGKAAKPGKAVPADEGTSADKKDKPMENVLDGAKKLKGMFGF